MRPIRFAAALVAFGLATSSVATADPIQTRKAIMAANGAAAAVSNDMVRGEMPFDPKVAALALATFSAVSQSFGEFFPEGSESGGNTRAAASIWEDRDGFVATLEGFAADAIAARATQPADVDAFRAAFQQVAQNCQACHEKYRVAQN